MSIAEITKKMIDFYHGNLHDINHFMKVHAYAKTIGGCEGLDEPTQTSLEVAAILHDIACPLCREKYGRADWVHQEQEGVVLAAGFLKDSGLPQACVDRVVYLVGHHHTPEKVDGPDYQILLEADYLVNAYELKYTKAHIEQTLEKMFKTPTGITLLKTMYLRNES